MRVCNCMYMDMLGNWIEDNMPIFTTDKWLMENVRDIEIDYIHGHRVVKFTSNRRISDGNGGYTEVSYSDDDHQPLHISEVVCRKPFRKMLPFIKYSLMNTLPKLRALRSDSLIFKFLQLPAIRCLSWSKRAVQSLIHCASSQTDATLIKCVTWCKQPYEGPRDVTKINKQQRRYEDLF